VRAASVRCVITLLGVAPRRSGESRACIAESKLRRSHGAGLADRLATSFVPAGQPLQTCHDSGESLVSGLAALGAMRACPTPASRALDHGSYNWSANADRVTAGFARLRASGYLQR
jgi:hypothetical protein